eukprot:4577554-Prymnesium_polylepis.2
MRECRFLVDHLLLKLGGFARGRLVASARQCTRECCRAACCTGQQKDAMSQHRGRGWPLACDSG